MQVHSVSDRAVRGGRYRGDREYRCTFIRRWKTLTRKDILMLTPQVYKSAEAADRMSVTYIEIGEEKTLSRDGVFVMASALNH